MALRAYGPYNGTLPLPTGKMVAFMRDPSKMPFPRYTQYVPAPGIVFSWWKLDPDEPARLPDMNAPAWPYDDYRPTGAAFANRGELVADRIGRWDFDYRIGEQTLDTWKRSGVDPQNLLNKTRMSQAMLHRAVRCVTALQSITATATPQSLLGLSGAAYLDQASGTNNIGGSPDPNFQLIQKVFGAVKQRMHLATNGALTGEEMIAVISPRVALALSYTSEMFEALKQSPFAEDLLNPILKDWRLPPSYGGFKLVVEDTPRCFINMKADGTTVADVTVRSQKDYILDDGIYFVSRPGGIDGGYGEESLATLSCFTLNGEAQVESFDDKKNRLVEGHIVLEDKVVLTSQVSGFKLTGVLTPA